VTQRRRVILVVLTGLAAATAAAMPFQRSEAPLPHAAAADTGRPAITILYQNFPNPFPTADSRATCIWFDLNKTASVSLTVHDVRGNLVRRILPNASTPQFLAPGRYGRATPTADAGCDPSLTWDGRDVNGSAVPRGVYLIRLRAGGDQSIKKAVFQGP
jgi:hypothetical protein